MPLLDLRRALPTPYVHLILRARQKQSTRTTKDQEVGHYAATDISTPGSGSTETSVTQSAIVLLDHDAEKNSPLELGDGDSGIIQHIRAVELNISQSTQSSHLNIPMFTEGREKHIHLAWTLSRMHIWLSSIAPRILTIY
jgi:hypothetical protein